jgi:crossover junction endodeoxyribonuclease RuvC
MVHTEMIAIGIDPGTINLGWGVVQREGNRLRHVGHGVIRVDPKASLSSRLLKIADSLDAVLQQYQPSMGSVEGMFFDKNAQSAAKLGHARGVVLLCLERRNVILREHPPARVKRTLTGDGRADKSQVARMVCAVLGLDVVPPSDASDALALAMTELRLDPRGQQLEDLRRKKSAHRLPPALAEAIARAKAAR